MNKILNIDIPRDNRKTILDKILKGQLPKNTFTHIVSLNPEILYLTYKSKLFKEIVKSAKIKLIDGIGIVIAAQILGIKAGERYTGVDFINDVSSSNKVGRLRLVFLGGRGKLAESLANCYSNKYAQNSFFGLQGIKNIKKIKKSENDKIFSIIAQVKPHFLFVSFGSPFQEIWIWENKSKLKGIICMGVGGAFDFLSGNIKRAPKFIQKIGLEWLYRLLRQPWRIKRQTRLIKFMYLVFKQKMFKSK
jgi:N-acetylglucosaminyldiphosphoundecaprenol N-acetyl-beta-D-mannosaminyltransferase